MSKRKRCKANTNSGRRCKNTTDTGDFCSIHAPKADEYGLTLKQKRFAEYFVASGNGVSSAELAGYEGSYSTLGVTAHDNLKKPKIQKYISELTSESGMKAKEVLQRLSNIARTSMTDVVDVDAETNQIRLNREKVLLNGSAIKKITIDNSKNPETGYENQKIRIELYPADQALVNLGRHHKLFTDVIEGNDKNWLVPVDPTKVDAMDPLKWVEEFKQEPTPEESNEKQ